MPQKKFEQNRPTTVREEAVGGKKVNTHQTNELTKQQKVVALTTACGSKPWLIKRLAYSNHI